MSNKAEKKFKNFEEFFPFYLTEHSNLTNRRLHVAGTCLGALLTLYLVATQHYVYLPASLVIGYTFSWVGHFVFEKNKPATFKYPVWSFMADWRMLYGVLLRQIDI